MSDLRDMRAVGHGDPLNLNESLDACYTMEPTDTASN